jgi:hypothetical protein
MHAHIWPCCRTTRPKNAIKATLVWYVGRMHIVIAHFHGDTLQHVADWWLEFMGIEKVGCQNATSGILFLSRRLEQSKAM